MAIAAWRESAGSDAASARVTFSETKWHLDATPRSRHERPA